MTVSLNLQSLNLQDYFEVIKPGFVRLKGHRIGIEHIVRSYQEGYTPEQMTQEFPGVGLEKIYATLAYYLHNQTSIDNYMAQLLAWTEQKMREYDTKEPSPVVKRLRKKATA